MSLCRYLWAYVGGMSVSTTLSQRKIHSLTSSHVKKGVAMVKNQKATPFLYIQETCRSLGLQGYKNYFSITAW